MIENTNKERAVQFLTLTSSGQIDEAYEQFVRMAGKHHSPYFAAGFEALKAGMKENYNQFPHKQLTIKNVVGEDDMVAVHSHIVLNPDEPGVAILHLFRFEHDKIVELWDFVQPVIADSPNTDGPF